MGHSRFFDLSDRYESLTAAGKPPVIKTLAGYDFSFQPSLDRNRVMALAGLDFINRAEVVHLLGPPRTGKSHIATALAVEAVKSSKSVYVIPLADLIAALAKAEREGTLREKIRFLCRASLLVVDEIGYLPVTPGGGNLLFQLVNARHKKGAMILTSNRGFAEWGDVFGDSVVVTALLDHLLHMLLSSRSRAPATACASTQTCCPNMSGLRHPSTRYPSKSDAGGHLLRTGRINTPADNQ